MHFASSCFNILCDLFSFLYCRSGLGPRILTYAVDCSPASRRPAPARHSPRLRAEGVIVIQFLASADFAATEQQNVALHSPHAEVSLAIVVDKLRARAANNAVNELIAFQKEYVLSFRRSSVLPVVIPYPSVRLAQRDPFPTVFDYFPAFRDRFTCENAITVRSRTAQEQRKWRSSKCESSGRQMRACHGAASLRWAKGCRQCCGSPLFARRLPLNSACVL